MLSSNSFVLRRPHYNRRGSKLFFLISARPAAVFSTIESEVWDAIGDGTAIMDLRHKFPVGLDEVVLGFVSRELCELVDDFPTHARRRVVVFEPHSDDAALSVGGAMWQQRDRCEFIIVTIGGRSNFTSYSVLERDFFAVQEITALRAHEGELVCRMLGGQYLALQLDEATLRYHGGDWSLEWFCKHKAAISSFQNHQPSQSDIETWKSAIKRVLNEVQADEVWVPLGVGNHVDHQIARTACLMAFMEEPTLTNVREVFLYEDVPYAERFPNHTKQIIGELVDMGAALTVSHVNIGADFAQKLRLISIYASQFKIKAIQKSVDDNACLRNTTVGGSRARSEIFWRIDRLPSRLSMTKLRVDYEAIRQLKPEAIRWIRENHGAPVVRILLLIPSGRWIEDADRLFQAFPAARFDIFASPAAMVELEESDFPQVRAHRVRLGKLAWLGLCLRIALRQPEPTLFVAGSKRFVHARWLARLWPSSHSLIVRTLDNFILATAPSKE